MIKTKKKDEKFQEEIGEFSDQEVIMNLEITK